MFGRIRRRQSGWTLMEMMFAVGLLALAGAAIGTMFLFSSRSLAAMANYSILSKANRSALDQLTREIRQAKQVLGYSQTPPTLSLLNGEGHTVVYSFNTTGRQMVRDCSDGTHQVLLDDCDLLQFSLYKRNPTNSGYGLFPVSSTDYRRTTKVLVLTWKTGMGVPPTSRITSEHIQTARIVIRKARTID